MHLVAGSISIVTELAGMTLAQTMMSNNLILGESKRYGNDQGPDPIFMNWFGYPSNNG
jgi:hypothetical protein